MIHSATAVAVPPRGSRHRRAIDEPEVVLLHPVPAVVMARWVERALRDLRGSVAEEALPEMAVQLARHRLLLAHRMTPLADDAKKSTGSRHAPLARRSAG